MTQPKTRNGGGRPTTLKGLISFTPDFILKTLLYSSDYTWASLAFARESGNEDETVFEAGLFLSSLTKVSLGWLATAVF